jgi:hypothetical protein
LAILNISASGSLIVDLGNSYINLEAEVIINSTNARRNSVNNEQKFDYFLDFKSSFEAILQ